MNDEQASSHGLEPLADDYAEALRPYCAEHDMYRPCQWCPDQDGFRPIGEIFTPPPEPGVVVSIPLPHGPNAALVADNATRAPEFLSHWEAQARHAESELPGKDPHLHPGKALLDFDRRVVGIWDRGGSKVRYNLERAVIRCEERMAAARSTLVEARRHVPQPRRRFLGLELTLTDQKINVGGKWYPMGDTPEVES